MTEEHDFLNVRSLAFVLTAAPLALLLLFGVLDMSWARHSQTPTKGNVATELTPKAQPASFDR